jgi:4-amino-4-deoxy-L-arabinose transferase-like glycosyltransferase
MTNNSQKYKKILLPGLIIIFLFFLLRLPNLTLLPIFADEAIYVRWAQVMRSEPTLRFLPLSDGKQPLYMWIVMVALRFFRDPLFCGRFISVLAGFGSLVGIFVLTQLLFKNFKTSLLAALFLSVVPFFVFFDRMALVDSLLNCLGIWFFILSFLLIKFKRWDLGMLGGLILGTALVTKSPALFFALLMPATLLFLDFKKLREKNWPLQLIKLFALFLIVFSFGFAILNLLRLGPNFDLIASRNQDYVFSLQEVLTHPLDPLRPHLNDLGRWFPNLLTWPIFLLSIFGLFSGIFKKKQRKQVFFLGLLSFPPILAQSMVARVFTPRYLLFATWPFLVFAAIGSVNLLRKLAGRFGTSILKSRLVLVGLLLVFPLFYDWQLLTDPQKAPLPHRMRSGYLEEWSSGYGIKETAEFIARRLERTGQNILIGTEGYFGTLPDGLQIYFDHHPRVIIIGVGWPIKEAPEPLLNATINNEVYLVVNQSRMLAKADPRLTLLEKFPKARRSLSSSIPQDFLLLFKVNEEPAN